MSPVVNVAATSAPPRNSSNIASSKARSHSARSYLHKQYLKVGLNRLQKHRPIGGLKSTLIHPSAWKEISAKSDFRFTVFSEGACPPSAPAGAAALPPLPYASGMPEPPLPPPQ